MTSYFLWHFAQFAASFTLKALVPLWQPPQFLPASISFMLMTIGALVALVGVELAVEYDLAGALPVELNRLAGRNCESSHCQGERYNHCEGHYEKLFHLGFT